MCKYSLSEIKNQKLIRIFLILVFVTIFTNTIWAQNSLDRQFAYADSLFNNANYFDAITEYKRLQFFDLSKQYTFKSNYRIALCYKAGTKFGYAIKYFSLSALNAKKTNDWLDSKFQIVRCNILRKSFHNALALLNGYESDKRFNNSTEQINYWRGWAYMLADKFDSAQVYFGKVSYGAELKKLSLNVEKGKYSITFAKVISFILPGAGQFYTGNYLSGIISFGWNILWGYLTVNAFISDRTFDGLTMGGLLWLRFYRGNIQNAEKFVKLKNIEISNKTLLYIENYYKGIKP